MLFCVTRELVSEMDPTRRQMLNGVSTVGALLAGCAGIAGGNGQGEGDQRPNPRGPWPAFGRDNANTAATSVSISETPSIEWTYDRPEDAVTAQPVVGSGHVVVGSHDGYVHCVRAPTGEQHWKIPTTGTFGNPGTVGGRVTGYPVLSAGVLGPESAYVPTTDSFITAMDILEGTKRFATQRNGGGTLAYTAPALKSGTLYAGSDVVGVHSYDTSSSNRIATYDTEKAVKFPPALTDGTLVAATADAVYAFDADGNGNGGGARRWRIEANPTGAPVIADGRAYVPENMDRKTGRLLALALTTGTREWEATVPSESSSPAVRDGRIYIAGSDRVVALQADGSERWRASVPTAVLAPAVAGERLLVPCANGELRGLTTADGDSGWTVDVGGVLTPPAVGDGRILVGSADGSLAAIA